MKLSGIVDTMTLQLLHLEGGGKLRYPLKTKQKGFKFEFKVFEPDLIDNRNEFCACIHT